MLTKRRMMLSFESLIFAMVVFSILAEHQFFYILPIDSGIIKMLLLLVVCTATICVIMATSLKGMKVNNRFLLLYCAVILLFFSMQLCYTMLVYEEQTLTTFLQMSQSYAWIFLMIPIIYLFSNKTGMNNSLEILKKIVALTMALYLIYAVVYNNTGRELLNISFYKKIMVRNARLRLWDLSSLEALAILWCFNKVLHNINRMWNLVLLAVMMAALLYVEQTRMMQIGLIVSMTGMFVLKKDNNTSSKIIKGIAIIFAILFIVISGIIDQLFSSFDMSSQFGSSTEIRLDEIKYAVAMVLENPIKGTGLIDSDILDMYYKYYGRTSYGYTDIGFLGLYAQIGIWSVLLYLWPMIRCGSVAWSAYKKQNEYGIFLVGLFSFLVISSATLLVLNPPRIYMWPWCLAIFEYCGYCIRHKKVIL